MDYSDEICELLSFDRNKWLWDGLNATGITKDENAWQNHSTPDEICDQMVNLYKDSFNNQQKILVLFNIEFIKSIYINYEYILYKNIYFVADTFKKYDWVTKNFSKINCVYLKEQNINNLIECIKGFNVKKFDIVFSNPPYGKKNVKLDLNILQSIFESAKRIVFIHPSTFIFDKKFKWKQYNDIRNTNFIEKLVTIWGNELFNIGLFCPLCISIWNTDKTSNEVEVIDNAITKTTYKTKINEVSIHGGNKIIIDFYKKIKEFIDKNGSLQSNRNYIKNIQQNDFSVKFATIRGHAAEIDGWNDDFFSLICINYKDNFCDQTFDKYDNWANSQKLVWSFNNENERINFINYCKSKFTRFCLSFLKNTSSLFNGELEALPWMDFTQEWNDKKLCEEFEISEELWNYIDNFIPDYYDDYKSGF